MSNRGTARSVREERSVLREKILEPICFGFLITGSIIFILIAECVRAPFKKRATRKTSFFGRHGFAPHH